MARRTLRASNTHLYPGARLTAGDEPALRPGDTVAIEFADLGFANAKVRVAPAASRELVVDAHRTRGGTEIVAKRWRVAPIDSAGDGPRVYRVTKRPAAKVR